MFPCRRYGLHGLPLPPRPAAGPAAAAAATASQLQQVTPARIREVYNVTMVRGGSSGVRNRQAVAEFQGQQMNERDLALFFQRYVPAARRVDPPFPPSPSLTHTHTHVRI